MTEPFAGHDTLLLVHRLVGYPLAFLVAPVALATFAGRWRHRGVGIAYGVGMCFLYLTGSVLTFTQYDYASWEFGRNVVFNLLGMLFVAHGVRAAYLWRHRDLPRPSRIDRVLRVLLLATLAVMAALALIKNTPLRAFTLLGITLAVLDHRDWRAGFTTAVLYARHARYILASYFYVLTVVSLVHLRDELAVNARWLWPAALGAVAIWITQGASTPGHPWRARAQRWAIAVVVAVAIGFGGYALMEVRRDGILTLPSPPPEAAPHRG